MNSYSEKVTVSLEPLSRIRHLALDMDGTIYKGGTLFPFTLPFLSRMKELGIGYTFLTNNSSKSGKDYLNHLHKMGIAAQPSEIFTSADSTIHYLRQTHPNVRQLFVLGTESLIQQFREAGFIIKSDDQSPELVIVGFDTGLPYDRLCKTAYWIKTGIPYIATHPDRVCPTDLPTVMVDCGAVCACLESATGVKPAAILGKPDRSMLSGIMAEHGLQPNELAMVGDRIYTDMAMARISGAIGVLVLTGECTAEDAESAADKPDFVLSSLVELGDMIVTCKRSKNV